MTNQRRKIEVFSAGCSCCESIVAEIKKASCPSCEVTVLDMKQADIVERANRLGVRSVPAIAINGKLAGCCSGRGPDIDTLRAAGLGVPLS
jgi:glutaredoxin 3